MLSSRAREQRLLEEGSPQSDSSADNEPTIAANPLSSLLCSCQCCATRPDGMLLPVARTADLTGNKIFGVAKALSPAARWIFLATNIGYWGVALAIFLGAPIEASLVSCARDMCSSAAFHGCLILLLAFMSTYWHGAQCQLMGCLYGALMHRSEFLRKLVAADVLCSVLTTAVGVLCFGPTRTFSWLAVPAVFFVGGAVAKRKGRFRVYSVLHGLWHMASATAIFFIVLTDSVAFVSRLPGALAATVTESESP